MRIAASWIQANKVYGFIKSQYTKFSATFPKMGIKADGVSCAMLPLGYKNRFTPVIEHSYYTGFFVRIPFIRISRLKIAEN